MRSMFSKKKYGKKLKAGGDLDMTASRMCPNKSVQGREQNPLLDRTDSLYDNVMQSDVKFIVGREPDTWLIPGHKEILAAANPVFRAQFEGPLASLAPQGSEEDIVVVEDVEGRAFDHFLRHLYGKEIEFQSVQTAVTTLLTANRYLCQDLMLLCVEYIDNNLSVSNVLYVYSQVKPLASQPSPKHHTPSAPYEETLPVGSPEYNSLVRNRCNKNNTAPNNNNNNNNPVDAPLTYWPNALLHNCLEFINENASAVLQQEEIEDLEPECLRDILDSPKLRLTSEIVVFEAVARWANRECKRRKLETTVPQLRAVLGDMLYLVRYGLLTSNEFLVHVLPRELHDSAELTAISSVISNSAPTVVPLKLEPYMQRFSERRIYVRNDYIALSQRSRFAEGENDLKKTDSLLKKSKTKKKSGKSDKREKRSMSIDSTKSEKRCSSSCFTEYVFDIISCIFD